MFQSLTFINSIPFTPFYEKAPSLEKLSFVPTFSGKFEEYPTWKYKICLQKAVLQNFHPSCIICAAIMQLTSPAIEYVATIPLEHTFYNSWTLFTNLPLSIWIPIWENVRKMIFLPSNSVKIKQFVISTLVLKILMGVNFDTALNFYEKPLYFLFNQLLQF